MKTNKWTILLALAAACATDTVKERPITKPENVVVKPTALRNTPKLNFFGGPLDMTEYLNARELIKIHANTDEFYIHMKAKRTYFAHASCKVADCIETWRKQLDQGDVIDVHFYTPFWKSAVVGGWDGKRINQNTKFKYNEIERAGHLLHEISHKYGWTHKGNYTNSYDNINSFPYAVGRDFEEYLNLKASTKLAEK